MSAPNNNNNNKSSSSSRSSNVITTEFVLKSDSTDRKFHIAKFMDKVEWSKFAPPVRIRQKKFHWENSGNDKAQSYYRFRKKNRLFYHKDSRHTWVIEDSTPQNPSSSSSSSSTDPQQQQQEQEEDEKKLIIPNSVARRFHKFEGQLEGTQAQQNYVIFVMGETKGEIHVLQTDKWFSFKPYEPEETEDDVNVETAERKYKKHIEREASLANHSALVNDQTSSSLETENRSTAPKVKHELPGINDGDTIEGAFDFDDVVSDDEEVDADQAGPLADGSDEAEEDEEDEEAEAEHKLRKKLKLLQQQQQQQQQKPVPPGTEGNNYGQYMQRLLRKQFDDSDQISRKVKPKEEEEVVVAAGAAEEQVVEGEGGEEKEKISNKRARKKQDSSSSKKGEPSKKRIKKEEEAEDAISVVATPPSGPGTAVASSSSSSSTPSDSLLDVAQLEEKFKQTLRERPRTAKEVLHIFTKKFPNEPQVQLRKVLLGIISSIAVLGEDKKLSLRDSHK